SMADATRLKGAISALQPVSSEDSVRQAVGNGGSHACVSRCPTGSWTGRAGFCASCQGHRDRGVAAPVDGAAPAGDPTAVHAAGPAGTGDVGAAAAPRAVGRVPGHAGDAAALAPGT